MIGSLCFQWTVLAPRMRRAVEVRRRTPLLGLSKRVSLLMLVAAIGACTALVGPQGKVPRIAPPGWNADYDYASGITMYLRKQYNSARLEGATAYIYVYDDAYPRCLRIRKMARDGELTAAFRDVRITMLDYERLKWLNVRTTGVAFDPGPWPPVIIKISRDGNLANAIIYPDRYLYQAWYVLPGKFDQEDPLTVLELSGKMQEFFRANSETGPSDAAKDPAKSM